MYYKDSSGVEDLDSQFNETTENESEFEMVVPLTKANLRIYTDKMKNKSVQPQ